MSEKHLYTARAFTRDDTYVTHRRHIEGRAALAAFKREARQQHMQIFRWRVFNETLDRMVTR